MTSALITQQAGDVRHMCSKGMTTVIKIDARQPAVSDTSNFQIFHLVIISDTSTYLVNDRQPSIYGKIGAVLSFWGRNFYG